MDTILLLQEKKEGFTVVSTDESFFFYDSLVRRVWISKNERPVVKITGSHQESVLFGATSLEGRQLFRQYDWFDQNTFLDYMKHIHRKFPKCYLFLDKGKQHYRSKKVLKYFADNKDSLICFQYTFQQQYPLLQNLWYWKIWHISKKTICLSYDTIIHHSQILEIKYPHTLEQKFNLYRDEKTIYLLKLTIRKHKQLV